MMRNTEKRETATQTTQETRDFPPVLDELFGPRGHALRSAWEFLQAVKVFFVEFYILVNCLNSLFALSLFTTLGNVAMSISFYAFIVDAVLTYGAAVGHFFEDMAIIGHWIGHYLAAGLERIVLWWNAPGNPKDDVLAVYLLPAVDSVNNLMDLEEAYSVACDATQAVQILTPENGTMLTYTFSELWEALQGVEIPNDPTGGTYFLHATYRAIDGNKRTFVWPSNTDQNITLPLTFEGWRSGISLCLLRYCHLTLTPWFGLDTRGEDNESNESNGNHEKLVRVLTGLGRQYAPFASWLMEENGGYYVPVFMISALCENDEDVRLFFADHGKVEFVAEFCYPVGDSITKTGVLSWGDCERLETIQEE